VAPLRRLPQFFDGRRSSIRTPGQPPEKKKVNDWIEENDKKTNGKLVA
jgi:hypothetical protein